MKAIIFGQFWMKGRCQHILLSAGNDLPLVPGQYLNSLSNRGDKRSPDKDHRKGSAAKAIDCFGDGKTIQLTPIGIPVNLYIHYCQMPTVIVTNALCEQYGSHASSPNGESLLDSGNKKLP